MAYRGEDLDLRLPQARGPRDGYVPNEFGLNGTRTRTPLGSSVTTGRADPVIVVDDTVMACCNHAYDIAQAHGASEVRLEHLVHALTRVEAAADILEERGIREAHLRRESAAVIASEIPVGLAHSQSAPRASAEFEDVLRRASDQASTQPGSRGATVHDLLWVLLNYNREIPAIALLLRHAAGWQSWDWPNRAPSREVVREEPRRRDPVRTERAVERRPMRQAPPPAYAPDPRDRVPQNGGAYASDAMQARLDQMEQSIRTLASEVSADRRALTDLIRDLQRDIQANGGGAGGSDTGAMIEQLRAVEANVEDRLGDLARTAGALTDRLHGLEKSVTGSLQEGSRNWVTVGDRLKSLDKLVASGSTSELGDLMTEQLVSVTEQVRQATLRLETLERNLEARQGDGQRGMSAIAERLRALDEKIDAQRREQQAAAATQSPAQLQSFVGERLQALKGAMDQSRLDLTSAMAQVVEPLVQRIEQVEANADRRHVEGGQAYQTLLQRVATSEPVLQGIAQQMSGFDASLKSQVEVSRSNLDEVHDALVKLGTNQQTLAGNLEQWRLESGGDLGIISNRLELLERGSAQPLEMLGQMQVDMHALQQVALADYDHNRRGFKNWLFGTDDIFANSWLDETSALRARLKQMRDGAKRA